MNSNRECAEYFRNQKVYDRCFQELWKKWRSYGRVAGKITLKETSEQERRAITGIIGKVFYERKIQFSLKEKFSFHLPNLKRDCKGPASHL